MNRAGRVSLLLALTSIVIAITACGGNPQPNITSVDPSGNWIMQVVDADGNSIKLSAVFNKTGKFVTASNLEQLSSCYKATFANGQVINGNQFSGDINAEYGRFFSSIHFASTLNNEGTHASGNYATTGECWGIAPAGRFIADRLPDASGYWVGTITCVYMCSGSATIIANLVQDNATGTISGTYTAAGLPYFSTGTFSGTHLSGNYFYGSIHDDSGLGGGSFAGNVGWNRSLWGVVGSSSMSPMYELGMDH